MSLLKAIVCTRRRTRLAERQDTSISTLTRLKHYFVRVRALPHSTKSYEYEFISKINRTLSSNQKNPTRNFQQ